MKTGPTRRRGAQTRRILHCDMDCFYAAVHMRDDEALTGLPIVVGGSPEGRGVVAAASYEARAFGVRSAMPAARARRLCPQALFIKPDFSRYRRESRAVFAILRDYTPVLQPVSIDEAYLDVSEHLGVFGSATVVAQDIRRRVREERGLSVSIGVAPNRLVAKIASDFGKPDGLTVVAPRRVEAFLASQAVRSLPGVGPVTQSKLEARGLRRVEDLRQLSVEKLRALVGSLGDTLFDYCRGRDDRPVRVHRERKSLSSERTYDRDLETLTDMDDELERLAGEVALGLERRSLSATTITVKVRFQDFEIVSRSRTLAAPTRSAAHIGRWARSLLRRTQAGARRVRFLGVAASNLVPGAAEQLELFGTSSGEGD